MEDVSHWKEMEYRKKSHPVPNPPRQTSSFSSSSASKDRAQQHASNSKSAVHQKNDHTSPYHHQGLKSAPQPEQRQFQRSTTPQRSSTKPEQRPRHFSQNHTINEVEVGEGSASELEDDASDTGTPPGRPFRLQGKSRRLDKASFLGVLRDMRNLDLTKLLGGDSLTTRVTLTSNGLSYKVSALLDTGANGYALIDSGLLKSLSPFLKISIRPLPSPFHVKTFNGSSGRSITRYASINMTVDKRLQTFTPFLVTNLGSHGIILGRQWFEHHKVIINCALRKLHWPTDYPPSPLYQRLIEITSLDPRKIQARYQRDARNRDRRLDAAWDRYTAETPRPAGADRPVVLLAPPRSPPPPDSVTPVSSSSSSSFSSKVCGPDDPTCPAEEMVVQPKIKTTSITTFAKDQARAITTMKKQLLDAQKEPPPTSLRKPSFLLTNRHRKQTAIPRASPAINIFSVSGHTFNLLARDQSSNELFSSSFHEIDRVLEEKTVEAKARIDADQAFVAYRQGNLSTAAFATCLSEISLDQPIPDHLLPWADVFSKPASDELPPHRSYDHKIELTEDGAEKALRYTPLYKMSIPELETTKQYLKDNLSKGFIEPSSAPYAAPILFVKKADGSLRFCIDYRALNLLSKKDRYPLPLIDETLARLSGAKIFTKLDIRQAFHRIRMDPASEELTTFRTRYGAYKCKVLPFGLTNGPATFQRYMNDVLFDYLDDFCTAYLDDILIYSTDPLEHQLHVQKVLQRLRDAGLQVDLKKCEFDVTETRYLGFIVSSSGIKVDPAKIEVVAEWGTPHTVRGVQSFLGFCNFYRRFIRDYGRIAKPLVNLTRANVPFIFDSSCEESFQALKNALTSTPILQHYRQDLPCMLETDASDGVVASVLSQQHGDDWLPVAFYSKTMAPPELNYPVHDKEMLAIIRSFGHFRAELAGAPHRVRVVTDHKALEYFMTSKDLNSRQARWAEALADYHFLITYRPGTQNPLADALTRRDDELTPQNATKRTQRLQTLLQADCIDPSLLTAELRHQTPDESLVSINEITDYSQPFRVVDQVLAANRISPSLEALRQQARSTLPVDDLTHPAGEIGPSPPPVYTLQDGLLLHRGRLIVPDVNHLRTLMIREVHDQVYTAHPSAKKTYQMLSSQYYWPGIDESVKRYVRNCHTCRRIAVPRDKKPGLLHPLPVPTRTCQHINMDFCSFNADKHGYDNVLAIIDRFSKQAISIPCSKKVTSKELARLYIYHVYRYFGPPQTITSDRGPQYISSFWKEFNAILGTKLQLSTAYHPETDGQTEIYNQYLQKRLRPFVNHYQDNWSELLPMMDYAQLTLPHDSLGGLAPFDVVHGYSPRTTWDWNHHLVDSETPSQALNRQEAQAYARRHYEAWKLASNHLRTAQERMSKASNQHRRPVDWAVGDHVYLDMRPFPTTRPSRKLDNPYAGPFKVLAKVFNSWRLELPSTMKVHDVFPSQRLRKAPMDHLPGQLPTPEEPINITGDEEYEVEEIIAVRQVGKTLQYRCTWTGRDVDLEFYPASDFKYAPFKLQTFHHANKELPGPPKLLPKWLEAFSEGRDEYDELDSDQAMDKRSRASFFRRGG